MKKLVSVVLLLFPLFLGLAAREETPINVAEVVASENNYWGRKKLYASFATGLDSEQGPLFTATGNSKLISDGVKVSAPDGNVFIPNHHVGLDCKQDFWFAVEIEMGFDASSVFDSENKDFINIVAPRGNGQGSDNDEGLVLHYNSIHKWLEFEKLGGKGFARAHIPPFSPGDRLRAVCGFSRQAGLDLWYQLNDGPVFHVFDRSQEARQPSRLPINDTIISISDSQAWSSVGDFRDEGIHRHFLIMQEELTKAAALDYLANPSAFAG